MRPASPARLAWGALLALLALPLAALADLPPVAHTAPPRPGRARARPPETPPLPAPELHLTLEMPSPDGPWTMRLENAGAVPLHVLADARLLAFEITAPESEDDDDPKPRKAHAPRPVRCELPPDMRPREYDERALVIPGGRSYVEKLDPRLFCFGAREASALVAGAKVEAHLVGSRESPAIEPIEEVEPKVASLTDLAGVPTTIAPPAPPPPPKDVGAPQPLTVKTPAFADFRRGWEAEVETTITNASRQPVALLFRPETVGFDVTGPSGVGVTDPSPTVRCTWPGPTPPPIMETYSHLAPKQKASITVLLSALCPENTLLRPGLYVVRARLDTRRASGASVGVRTFTGEVLAAEAIRVRVRESTAPPTAAARPQLAPLPAPTAH